MAQDPQGAPGEEMLPEIPGYRIDSLLGSGGMGHVYLGTSPSGRQVAVKVIRGNLVHQPDFRRRFRREVTAARQVSGAFTAPVVDADPDADPPWMATLYVPGQPLDERVRKGPALTDEELYRLATGLAEALRDIHRVAIVHRDLKPGNVLLADDGPRVIDFGIVRAADGNGLTAPGLTGTGVTVGTPPFMSPEQIRAQKDVGPRSDIFSLGSVLTYAASGHVPFDATDVYTMVYQLVHEPPKLDGLPDWLRPVVERCLAKEPEERPDAGELLTMLGEAYPGALDTPVTKDSSATANPSATTNPSVTTNPSASTDPPAAPEATPPPVSPSAEGEAPRGTDADTASPAGAPDPASTATDMGAVTTDTGAVPAPPPRRGRRRRVLAVAAAVMAVTGLTGGLVYGLRDGGEGTDPAGGRSPRPTSSAGSGAVTQPEGSAAYLGSQSGSGGFSFAYHDSPERRPEGWRPWQRNLQNSDCVYAESSLVCIGDRTVRLDAATGKELWRNDEASYYGSNNMPVVVGDTVVVNIGDRVMGLALSDGSVKWRYATATLTENLMGDGERVYVVDEGGVVHSVDARTGRKSWLEGARTSSLGGTGNQPALRVAGDRLYVFASLDQFALGDDHVTVFDKDSGRILDDFALATTCTSGTEAVLEEDGEAQLYCAWMDKKQAPMSDAVLRQELVKGAKGIRTEAGAILGGGQSGAPELSVTPGRVLFIAPTAAGGELVAVDAVGRKELWRTELPGRGPSDAPPIQAGDRVYAVNTRGVAVFDARTGKPLYRHSLPYLDDDSGMDVGLHTEPLVAGGVIYAPSTKVGWVSLDTEAEEQK
ncbi:serine/threonine-protein kinase [Streptomyces sp. NBC_00481]|uniref:serine/threonine-protein kinase n=1 Tax=Streptomyces sp. NBC_00481 TaxID=2975755 RepID=UPI002DDC490B|nr:PQQ-binding-like beta-propeller repeat protein [Streptomyces sp. NBC_00481]WRY98354.1 serine/threonine-protein kinase [Streptomyces sp. NBC_00481]